jgi:hypothetical protein
LVLIRRVEFDLPVGAHLDVVDRSTPAHAGRTWRSWPPRPLVELEPTDHPLAVEQRTGITLGRVQEIAETLLHRLPTSGS